MEWKQWEMESIYRIPWSVKELHRSAYQPQRVSIGPYHHGEAQLVGMEKHKERALDHFLDRKKKPLEYYMNALEQEVDHLMAAYDQLQPNWQQNREAFLKLMILDGCFILELLETEAAFEEMGYAPKDPVFGRQGHLRRGPLLRRDMLMLENQIPLLVLNTIVLVADGGDLIYYNQRELNARILQFFRRHNKTMGSYYDSEFGECLHILDLYRKSLLGWPRPPEQRRWRLLESGASKEEEAETYIRSATELVEAGIQFEVSETRKLNDILFESGVLKLPVIELVDETLESEYLNMLAFEQSHAEAGREVTSYLFLMDRLIDSAKDVSLLYRHRIIRKSLVKDHAVANLFNSLSSWEATLDPDNWLFQVQKDVSKYYWSRLPRCKAFAKHNYFTNPWVTLSVLAAIFLFALTTVQTAYSVLGYYDDHGKNASKHCYFLFQLFPLFVVLLLCWKFGVFECGNV